MAEEKKGVIFYCDLIHTFEKLILKDRINKTNNSGELIYHYLQYINDRNPEPINDIIDLAFEPMKQTLKRDLIKWQNIKGKRSDAGKASAEKRKQNATNPTHVESVKQNATNPTVSDSVIVSVSDSVSVKEINYDYFIVNGKIEKGNVVDWYLQNHQPNYEALLMQLSLSSHDEKIKQELKKYFINGFSFNDYKHIANSFKKHIIEHQKELLPKKPKMVY